MTGWNQVQNEIEKRWTQNKDTVKR